MFSVPDYLERLGWSGATRVDEPTLAGLHEEHMERIPFENLDIHRSTPIVLDEERIFDKLITRRRGGFCYELNGAFAGLLRRLGFDVTLLSAGVAREDGGFGPEFDHMALLVRIGQTRWMADVGFGDSFRRPLLLDSEEEQSDGDPRGFAYRFVSDGETFTYVRRVDEWKPEYVFTLRPRELREYTDRCHYHQTSPASSFTRKIVCSRATPEGRITLTGDRLIATTAAGRDEVMVAPHEWDDVLRREFGIAL